ncbi:MULTISPECIES: RsmB/NOP family class I SAM-dependent RNA methyltransferase [Synergistaceae]|jgi:16S rRNA (cytosine967-C5)-methyltransferase|uniref:RsmB/NOP family class I SAM-dependent RNA methyltransferase n=1 Tax=Synergistaceae TaxID=649777 RepID=UPI003AD906AF|nr:RNA methyltransferase [Synergistaceae bacterium DZ-S4]
MRGIEAALRVYGEVNEGAFAAEALRKLYTDIAPSDRVLAATLVYCSLRRQGLWKHLLMKYCRRNTKEMSVLTHDALIVGIAGIVELRYFALPVLINGLVQAIKSNGEDRDIGLVNAVLHTVADEAKPYLAELKKSSALRDQALYWGIPGWAAAQWSKDMSIPEAKRLVRGSGMRTYLSLRLSRGVDRDEWLTQYRASGKKAWASPLLDRSVRTPANPYPLDIPGFSEGRATPQSESSMFVAEAFSRRWKGEPLLDMCCGRGIKTGQLADMVPEAEIEAWDISEGRIRAAEYEMIRMRIRDRVKFRCGDSLSLVPSTEPKAILLDAPCTGSGTWGRHPESKWRITPEMVTEAADLQRKLLERAVSLVAPGGVVAYSTCSMFREENEKVVAAVMARHPELTEAPVERSHKLMSKGKPYGTVIWPGLPWIDGFYLALLVKRK